ncbi:hypothetical protein LO772_19050 [Yinghuangia sp. ASG 101]|uniref:hypothetical protein n=1 Tax=Yinghuangia sp. ASG 101 TaxID=2896848 RepID=UPI001E369391|nr:hypothetical protein [Yinghuangia sp. ASG 101]UGQ15698.1 hypothetical protein LO772_19050 [Yinghuangia sp. ASG 101]
MLPLPSALPAVLKPLPWPGTQPPPLPQTIVRDAAPAVPPTEFRAAPPPFSLSFPLPTPSAAPVPAPARGSAAGPPPTTGFSRRPPGRRAAPGEGPAARRGTRTRRRDRSAPKRLRTPLGRRAASSGKTGTPPPEPAPEALDPNTVAPTAEPTAAPAPDPAPPGRVSSFVRFMACGGGTGVAAGAAVAHMSDTVPVALANAVVTVVATLLTNELHSRVTFRRGRAGWRVHVQSSGTAVASYLFTTTAMLVLDALAEDPGAFTEQATYLAASAAAGVGRFAALRMVVFGRDKKKSAA